MAGGACKYYLASGYSTEQEYNMNDKQFDMILKAATVIDPSNQMNRVADVGIKDGKIVAIGPGLGGPGNPVTLNLEGFLVTPGLIDMHCHVYPVFPVQKDGLATIQAEAHMFQSGVTTCVDAGTCGCRDFIRFKEEVIDKSALRILAFINIASGGMVNLASEQNIREFYPGIAAAMARAFGNCVVGIKTAHYRVGLPEDEAHPLWESVDRALEAGCLCQMPVMADFQPNLPGRSYQDLILKKLRPKDIHTHVYARQFPILDQGGRVNDFMFAARERGVVFDLGHGAGSFLFRNAVPALEQGFYPDTISTDLYSDNVAGPVINLLHIMSKYLNMGMPLAEVIYRTTKRPAQVIGHPELGDISIGSCADIAVLKQSEGKYGFADSGSTSMAGNRRLECMMTIRAGKIVYNPMAIGLPDWNIKTAAGN